MSKTPITKTRGRPPKVKAPETPPIPQPVMARTNRARTTQGLRDILFDEIEELRTGNGDPTKSLAVAHLARQIVNTAKVEIDFQRHLQSAKDAGRSGEIGGLLLGQG